MILISSQEGEEVDVCLHKYFDSTSSLTYTFRPMPTIHIMAKAWIDHLIDSRIITKYINPVSLEYIAHEWESKDYTKINYFPIRYLWENHQVIDNIYKWFFSGDYSFKQAFLLGHYFEWELTFPVSDYVDDEHSYFPVDFPIDFYEVVDSINNSCETQGDYENLSDRFNTIQYSQLSDVEEFI